MGKCGQNSSKFVKLQIKIFFSRGILGLDCHDMQMTQKDVSNQKLQMHEGRSNKIVLEKSLFFKMYI